MIANLRVFFQRSFPGCFAEASTVGYGHGFFPSSLRAAVPGHLALHATMSAVSHYTPARWRTRIILARVNYELRKIVSEDDLHTQRAARKGIDVRRASLGFFMSQRGKWWAGWKKKGFVGHRLPLHAEIPALVRRAMVPVYIVSREKEKARASCAPKISRRANFAIERDDSHDYGVDARDQYPSEFFLRYTTCYFNTWE